MNSGKLSGRLTTACLANTNFLGTLKSTVNTWIDFKPISGDDLEQMHKLLEYKKLTGISDEELISIWNRPEQRRDGELTWIILKMTLIFSRKLWISEISGENVSEGS